MGCTIEVNLSYQTPSNNVVRDKRTFASDAALDEFLMQHEANLSTLFKDSDRIIYSLTETQGETITKLNELNKLVKNLPTVTKPINKRNLGEGFDADTGEEVFRESIKNAIGATKFVENVGLRHRLSAGITAMAVEEYEIRFKQKVRDRILGIDPNTNIESVNKQANYEWKLELQRWDVTAQIGDEIHYLFDCQFKNQNYDPTQFKLLTEEQAKEYNDTLVSTLVNRIKSKFLDAQFFTEFKIASKLLSPAIKNRLKETGYTGVDRIEGIIDLLVIDKHGKAHIFDWKTSSRQVGNWGINDNDEVVKNNYWHTTKKNKAFAQLAVYGAILQQWGIPVDEMQLVPLIVNSHHDSGKWTVLDVKEDSSVKAIDSRAFCNNWKVDAETSLGVTEPMTSENLKEVGQIMETIVPKSGLGGNLLKHFKAKVEYYKEKKGFKRVIDKTHSRYKEGYRYFFYPNGLKDHNTPIWCKNEQDFDEKVAKYCEELDKIVSNEMKDFTKNLSDVINSVGTKQELVDTWLSRFTDESKSYLKNTFRKYIDNGWQILVDDALNNNGRFFFKRGNQIDLVILSNLPLHQIIELKNPNTLVRGNLNHTMLGAKLDDRYVDTYFTMNSSYGNALLISGLALIAQNPTLLGKAKINTIKVVNPWYRETSEVVRNEYLFRTWEQLVQLYPDLKLNRINPSTMFFDDVDVCMHEMNDALMSQGITDFSKGAVADGEQDYRDYHYLIHLKKKLERVAQDQNIKSQLQDPTSRIGYANYQLDKAIGFLQNSFFYTEPDMGDFSRGGLHFTNPAQSLSNNMRKMNDLQAKYRERYSDLFIKETTKMRELSKEVCKEWGIDWSIDNMNRGLWEHFFVKDDGGAIDKQMILKRPTDPEFKDKPKTQEFILNFVNTLGKYKYENLGMDYESISNSQDFWEVPLIEADFGRYVREAWKRDGFNGVFTGIKTWGSEKFATVHDLYKSQDRWKVNDSTRDKKDSVYNRYLDLTKEERNYLIDKHDAFDIDLLNIFSIAMERTAVAEASKQFACIFIAFKTLLTYHRMIGGVEMPEIERAINRLIDSKIFLKDVMTDSAKGIAAFINMIKQVTGAITLVGNTKNFAKEMSTMFYTGMTRAANSQIPNLDAEDFVEGLIFVTKHAPAHLKQRTLMEHLNMHFGLVDFGITSMAEYMSRPGFGLYTYRSGDGYILTKLPDDYYRMAILVAYMKKDGCLDAYVETETGWKYDIKKDPRFKHYVNNDKSDIKQWAKEKSLFLDYLNEWKSVYPDQRWISTDDDPISQLPNQSFPDCYPPSIKGSIRNVAGTLYGFFDHEDKSLLYTTLIGSALMQYKTFAASKWNQFFKSGGYVNIFQRYYPLDDQGRIQWKVSSTPEEIKAGQPVMRLIPEDDPTLEQYIREGRAEVYVEKIGTFQQGSMLATAEFLLSVIHMDANQFKAVFEDPIKKGQFINGLLDSLGMLLLAAIIKAIFGEDVVEHRKEQDWFTQWSYSFLLGFAEDGPVWSVATSMFGDFNPPAIGILKKWAKSAHTVLTGDKQLAAAIIENVGALREFQGLFYE